MIPSQDEIMCAKRKLLLNDHRAVRTFCGHNETALVIYARAASGTAMRPPAKAPLVDAPAYYQQARRNIEAANHITIVGGGAVGLELAGEIRAGRSARRVAAAVLKIA